MQANDNIVCALSSNGQLGLIEYKSRLEEIKTFVKMRMRIFFSKVELINDRIKQNKMEKGFSPQSEIKYAPSAE